MQPAIGELVRKFDVEMLTAEEPKPLLDEDVEILSEDDMLLDPWFFKSESEIAEIEDDPTAKVIQIRLGPLKLSW